MIFQAAGDFPGFAGLTGLIDIVLGKMYYFEKCDFFLMVN
jgi:hypothetical protein